MMLHYAPLDIPAISGYNRGKEGDDCMKHIWTKRFPDIYNGWFHGALIKEDLYLKYYFFYPSNIAQISDLTLHLDNGELISYNQDPEEAAKYKELYYTSKHYDGDFVFGEYRITHHGQWGYACFKEDKLLWKKSLRGYLYTDIIKNGNQIIFGTAGMGGHFYSLNIDSGDIVFDFNTKGTCKFLQIDNDIYFAMSQKKNTVIYRIDYNGNVLDSLEVEGTRNDENPFMASDNSIYIVTSRRKKEVDWETYYPIVHRIALY